MTHEEALIKALETLHKISIGAYAKHCIEINKIPNNVILANSLREQVINLQEIETLAADVWEEIVMQVEPKLSNITIFICSPKENE